MVTSTADFTSIEPSTSASGPWPPDLDATDQAAAAAALDAYLNYWRISDASRQAPSAQDWSVELEMYAGDEWWTSDLESLNQLVTANAHQTGRTEVEASVVSVSGDSVTIRACVDPTKIDYVDPTGASVADTDLYDNRFVGTGLLTKDAETALFKVQDLEVTDQPC